MGPALPQTKHTNAASSHSSENRLGSTATLQGMTNKPFLIGLGVKERRHSKFSRAQEDFGMC